MPRTIEETAKSFSAIAQRIEKIWIPHCAVDSSFKTAVAWQLPALTPGDAMGLAKDIAARLIESCDGRKPSEVNTSEFWEGLAVQADQIDFVNFTSNMEGIVRSTYDFLFYVSARLPSRTATVNWDSVKDAGVIPKSLASKLRSLEDRLKAMEPRTVGLAEKIAAIESAHDAAEQLPTDLEELRSAKETVKESLAETSKNSALTSEDLKTSREVLANLHELKKEAEQLIDRFKQAYRITTSTGLAGAFEYRSRSLARVGWVWVSILISALGVAIWLGKDRYDTIREILSSEHSPSMIYLNLIFAVLGVAAPVWLAWLATRSIGQSFRLSEDYAYKASISKAYEGYREEAISLDGDFARRLFGSALSRLDEAPSRFIVNQDHNSPVEELLRNETLQKFFELVPEAQERFTRFLIETKSAVAGAVVGSVAAIKGASAPAVTPDDKDS
jgi:hypothetical protein